MVGQEAEIDHASQIVVPTPNSGNELFFNLIENAPLGIYLVDAQFRLAQISIGCRKVFTGIDPLLGRDFGEIIRIVWPEPFATAAIIHFRHTLATGDAYHSPNTTERRGNIQAVESYDWQIERVRLGDGQFGVVCYFYETTHRVNAERDAYFLGDLSEQIRRGDDVALSTAEIIDRTASYLQFSRCFLTETDEVLDRWLILHDAHGELPAMPGDYRVSAFPLSVLAELRTGLRVICEDASSEARWRECYESVLVPIGIRALIAVPLLRDGKWVSTLVGATQHPRVFSGREIALLETVAKRTWEALENLRLRTTLAESETLLKESERRFREMAELTPQFIWVSRPDGSLEYVNRKWTEYSGLDSAATADNEELGRAIHPDDRVRVFDSWAQSVRTGEPFDVEARLRRSDGAWRWFMVRTVPVRAEGGEILRWFGASSDIHDFKLVEAALRVNEQHLLEAHERLEERVRQRTGELHGANQALEAKLVEERAAQARITALVKQLVTIQEEERHRVARELHDQLGQPMTALRMHLNALQLRELPILVEPIATVMHLAEDLDRSIDFLVWQLRPSDIDNLGLSGALANLVSNWSQQFYVAANYESDEVDALQLASDVETHLYRITQEALHNVYKHARAAHVLVRLGHRHGNVVLTICDDGRGLKASGRDVFAVGMGLSNMRDRARLAGGELFVFWSSGGSMIEVRLPPSALQ